MRNKINSVKSFWQQIFSTFNESIKVFIRYEFPLDAFSQINFLSCAFANGSPRLLLKLPAAFGKCKLNLELLKYNDFQVSLFIFLKSLPYLGRPFTSRSNCRDMIDIFASCNSVFLILSGISNNYRPFELFH